ncbi:MAG: hypothetical protein N2043_11520 [Ignavibacterium sp.]|nr:hypothetical protein [Ignavibacterium sp.]
MKALLLIIISISITKIIPQDVGISLSGFVKTDIIFDSRQTVSLREGHFLLYPQPEKLDLNNNDVNAKANFNILSIQTRLSGKIKGPKAFESESSGYIEAEFFGTSDGDINGLRLRHAFVKFDWGKTFLLVGQTWHPLFIDEVFPGVVSFNTGAPFQPFSRNPQIRLSHKFDNFRLILTAASQRDFTSSGPEGFSSSYLRNSLMPNLNANIQFAKDVNNLFGVGVDYKKIIPRIVTSKNFVTDISISTLSITGYVKLNPKPFLLKSQVVYGYNLSDLMMLGGYAVRSINQTDGKEEYTGIKVLSFWGEIIYGKEIEYGLFIGYSKNLGADDIISGAYYGRSTNIDKIYRISPRVQYNSGNSRISTELEYTSAYYGINDNLNKGKVINSKSFNNLRFLVAVYQFF